MVKLRTLFVIPITLIHSPGCRLAAVAGEMTSITVPADASNVVAFDSGRPLDESLPSVIAEPVTCRTTSRW